MAKAFHITKKREDDHTLSEREAAFAAQNQIIKDSLSLVKHKFIVMNGKGGVGKTSVAASLAIALSKKGARVGT
jgi:Mrp family chromosome partitioning ATPase